jgi:hypothetical protein
MAIGSRKKRRVTHRRKNPVAVYNPRRKKRRKARGFFANPRRRARRRNVMRANPRRRHRRNPPMVSGLLSDTMYAGIGYIGTKFAVGSVLPAINIAATPPSMTSIFAKAAVAYGVAWGGGKVMGDAKFVPIFLGGMASVIQDIVTLYIAPSIPALAGHDSLNAYYHPPMIAAPRRALPAPGVGSYYGELSAEDMI